MSIRCNACVVNSSTYLGTQPGQHFIHIAKDVQSKHGKAWRGRDTVSQTRQYYSQRLMYSLTRDKHTDLHSAQRLDAPIVIMIFVSPTQSYQNPELSYPCARHGCGPEWTGFCYLGTVQGFVPLAEPCVLQNRLQNDVQPERKREGVGRSLTVLALLAVAHDAPMLIHDTHLTRGVLFDASDPSALRHGPAYKVWPHPRGGARALTTNRRAHRRTVTRGTRTSSRRRGTRTSRQTLMLIDRTVRVGDPGRRPRASSRSRAPRQTLLLEPKPVLQRC